MSAALADRIRERDARCFTDDWKFDYSGSYAFQTDANDNPRDYNSHYLWSETVFTWKPVGRLGVGFEMLGSDHGDSGFVTPLTTVHKFNGFADAFLDNGGRNGLQDLFVTLAPRLPFGLAGKLIYHHIWADHGGDSLGNEIDGVISKKLGYGVSVLAKEPFTTRPVLRAGAQEATSGAGRSTSRGSISRTLRSGAATEHLVLFVTPG